MHAVCAGVELGFVKHALGEGRVLCVLMAGAWVNAAQHGSGERGLVLSVLEIVLGGGAWIR